MTGTPNGRRITRAASTRAASATPAPSVASFRTRAKTPKDAQLPAVPTAISSAYGASGKVSLASQMDITGGEGKFAETFAANRSAAISRDIGEREKGAENRYRRIPPSAALSRVSDAPSTVSSDRVSVSVGGSGQSVEGDDDDDEEQDTDNGDDEDAEDEDDDEEDDDEEDDDDDDDEDFGELPKKKTGPIVGGVHINLTDLETTFSYTESIGNRGYFRPACSIEPPATREELEAARPWSVAVLWETFLRWLQVPLAPFTQLPTTIKNILVTSLVSLVVLSILWPTVWHDISAGGASFIEKAGGVLTNPFPSPLFGSPSHDPSIIQRFELLESDVRRIQRGNGKKTPKDTRSMTRSAMELLRPILPKHVVVHKTAGTGQWEIPAGFWIALREKFANDDSTFAWNSFIAANKVRMEEYTEGSERNTQQKRAYVISQNMFIERLEQIASSVALRTNAQILESIPSVDRGSELLHNLALVGIAHNTEIAIQTVNYFSFNLGATIEPYLTSPTYTTHTFDWFRSLFYTGPTHHVPVKALKPWEEATDCWCAAESDIVGKAQLGVLMPIPIVPTSITFEHIPARGTLDIGAAPKDFEVWVTSTEMPMSEMYQMRRDGSLSCGEEPAKGFVCIGQGRYDIHGPNHIQNFPLASAGLGVPVNKAIVKVKNNWGKTYTCLYRIRMHGEVETNE